MGAAFRGNVLALLLSVVGWGVGSWFGRETYGLRGCCRRRRVRAVFVFGFGCGGLEGLRFRIGCVRRRMSRRGGCGWGVGLSLLMIV